MANLVQSRKALVAIDLDQSVEHPLVLFARAVSAVLQHQPGLGHPNRVG